MSTTRRRTSFLRAAIPYRPYSAAVGSVVLIALAEDVWHVPIDDRSRFLILLVPVAVSAWLGGIGPGLVGLAMSGIVAASFLPPRYSLRIDSPGDIVSLALYVVVSLVFILIIESQRRSKRALQDREAEIGKLNEDLNRSLSATEDALWRQKRFTSDASHELKTPLTAIRARCGISQSGPVEQDELMDHLAAIGRAAEVMTTLVQDLLLLAASDEGQLGLVKELCPVANLIEDALASVDATRHDVQVSVEDALVVECDPSAVTRVLVNLLQNAIAHTVDAGKICVVAKTTGSAVSVVVSDEGAGIPQDQLGLIFDRFHRVDRSRNRGSGGSGLGLAIAKAIVDAHGGSIGLKSVLGKGTTVTILLPCSQPG